MLASKTKSVSRYDLGNAGLKCSKTLSAIERVSRVFKSQEYSPDQRKVFPFAIDLARLPKLEFGFGKIITHDTDKPDWREEACTERCIGSRTTQQIGMLLHRCLDRIECDGTDNQQRHMSSDWTVQKIFAGTGVFGDVGRLEQAGDYRNPARACSNDLPKIVGLNSANTKDRENHIAMDALNLL